MTPRCSILNSALTTAAHTRQPDRSLVRTHIAALTLILTALAATACGSDDEPSPTLTLSLPTAGRNCLQRQIDNQTREICFIRDGEIVSIEADGLQPGSTLTIEGQSGDTANLDVTDDAFKVEVGARIVSDSFTARGTWLDGEPLFLGVDYTD